MLKSLIFRVESDFGFRPEGVAMDFDKIERHVQARSSRLLKTTDSICTPELEVLLILRRYRLHAIATAKKRDSEAKTHATCVQHFSSQ